MKTKRKKRISAVSYEYYDRLLKGRDGQPLPGRAFDHYSGLERKPNGDIELYLGRSNWKNSLVIYRPIGEVVLTLAHWPYPITQRLISRYSPFVVWTERSRSLPNYVFGRLGYTGEEFVFNNPEGSWEITLSPNGELGGDIGDADEARQEIKEARARRRRVANRSLYWLKKARGLFVDRSGCEGKKNCVSRGTWYRNLRAGQGWTCGCKIVRKEPKCKGLTVQSILGENNASVRAAQMTCYGIGKFFLDARAEIIHEHEPDYQLMRLKLPATENRSEQEITALQMVCPSTGQIHVNTVPPGTQTVPDALNWMFGVPDYLQQVGQQT